MLLFTYSRRLCVAAQASLVAFLVACGGGNPASDNLSQLPLGGNLSQSTQPLGIDAQVAANSPLVNTKKGQLASISSNNAAYHPTRVLAKLVDPVLTTELSSRASKFASIGLRQISGFALPVAQAKQAGGKSTSNGVAVFEITDPALSVAQAIAQLKRSGLVVYAEPDYYLHTRLAPNDPSYGIYWHLKNTGQIGTNNGLAGIAGNDINVESAWNITTGDNSMVVAVIDSGVKFDHPDLQPNMWSSAGTPRVVVSGDPTGAAGVTDDFNGANLSIDRPNNDTSIMPYSADARSDHGTMVSGFVGARGNNSVGGTGVSWNVKIMGIKIEGPTTPGGAATSSIVNGVRYVIAKKNAGVNVRVINISYGGPGFSRSFSDALQEASDAGILVVVAAGNDGSSDPALIGFPAGYQTPNLISVGALNRSNGVASFSNFGSLVHLFAPGENVPTTSSLAATTASGHIAPFYRYINGTSFASPIVAGAAALIWMQYPGETSLQIKQRLLAGTSPFSSTFHSLTAGKLNVNNSISPTVPCTITAPSITNLGNSLTQGATHRISVFMKPCPGISSMTVDAAAGGVTTMTQIRDDGVFPDEKAGDAVYTGSFVTPASASTSVQILVTARNASGTSLGSASSSKTLKAASSFALSNIANSWDALPTTNEVGFAGSLDDSAFSFTPGFPVNFDGRSFSTIYISTNGYICLENTSCVHPIGLPIPSGRLDNGSGSAQAIVAPWWNDWLLCPSTSGLGAATLGTAPNRRVVVSWRNVLPYYDGIACNAATTNGVSFQAVFYEGQNHIDYRYQDVTAIIGTLPSGLNPSSGLIGSAGIQLLNGKLGTQLSYNVSNFLATGTTFRFTPSSPSFSDVFATDFFAASVEGLRGTRITVGCSATEFCADFGRGRPDAQIRTTQQQMAAFLARAILGHDALVDYTVYPASGFTDVFTTFTRYVNYLKSQGIMTGTGLTPTTFCQPDCDNDFVTRAQMARYLVRAVRGASYVPPAATGVFTDVPASHPEAAFIEEVARMKITLGIGNGAYGPSDIVTRGQMATFLQRTFRPFDAQ